MIDVDSVFIAHPDCVDPESHYMALSAMLDDGLLDHSLAAYQTVGRGFWRVRAISDSIEVGYHHGDDLDPKWRHVVETYNPTCSCIVAFPCGPPDEHRACYHNPTRVEP